MKLFRFFQTRCLGAIAAVAAQGYSGQTEHLNLKLGIGCLDWAVRWFAQCATLRIWFDVYFCWSRVLNEWPCEGVTILTPVGCLLLCD